MSNEIVYQANAEHTQMPETWVLVLGRYQRDNLLFLLNKIGWPHQDNPHADIALARLNTGDWVGEIGSMLAKVTPYNFDGDKTVHVVIDDQDRPNR